jgi:hypothetical protein
MWPEHSSGRAQLAPATAEGETFYDKVQALAP